jgi:hypothetical protein
VREATDAIQAEANRLYDEGRQIVRDRVRSLRDRNGQDSEAELGLDQTTTYGSGTRPESISPMPAPVPPANEIPRS